MNLFGITPKSHQLLIDTFMKYHQIEEVILFGSRAKGNYKKGSDIDLAINGKECSPRVALDISGIINEELPIPYYVDVVDYKSLEHKDLKNHIDNVGVAFYKKQ
jgi:predicted nucleotidyltransferase